jgi:hypothetical protein
LLSRCTTASDEQLADATSAEKQQYLVITYLVGSDRTRYGKLLEDLENSYLLQGREEYPTTLTGAYNLLVHWQNNMHNAAQIPIASSDGVAFTNVGDNEDNSKQDTTLTTDGKPKKDRSHITCFNCNEQGHYASDCTKA